MRVESDRIRTMATWRHGDMATTLRLSSEAVDALRAAAKRSGRSQQDLLREAVDRYLGLGARTDPDRAMAHGRVKRPTAFRDVRPLAPVPGTLTTLDLLDRDDDR
jgi:hypothetical protein